MKKNNFKSLMILMVLSVLLFSNLAVALDDIPGNAPVGLPSSDNSFSVTESSGLFSVLQSMFSIVMAKTSYNIDEDIKIISTQTSWNLICEEPFVVIDIYQNGGNPIESSAKQVSSVDSQEQRTYTWTIQSGVLSEGPYGAQSYLWCGDSQEVLCANNVYRGEGNICEAESKLISGFDLQDFSVSNPGSGCIEEPEICDDGIDNDCDGTIDESTCIGDDCTEFASQKCYDNDVYYYDSCNNRQPDIANDCSLNEQCIDSRCETIVIIECTTGQTDCDGTTYYECSNNNWVSKGKVVGECGYTEEECTSDSDCESGEQCVNNVCQTIVITDEPLLEEVSHKFETLAGNKIKGTFVLKNIGASMTKNWILEMQVNKQEQVMAFVSPEIKTCNSLTPQNVHKEFKINSGEEITIELISEVPDSAILSNGNTYVLAVITEYCGCNNDIKFGTEGGGETCPSNTGKCYKEPYCAANTFGQIVVTQQEGCVQPLYDEDLKDSLFQPSASEVRGALCLSSADCCKVTDYKVGCVREEIFEDRYGIDMLSGVLGLAEDIGSWFGTGAGVCVAKEKNGDFDLGWFTEDSIIPNIQNWIILLGGFIIVMIFSKSFGSK